MPAKSETVSVVAGHRQRNRAHDPAMSCLLQVLSTESELLCPTPFTDYPWQKVATDLFEWRKNTYLLVVDYYSRYTKIQKLTTTTSADVIRQLKSIFARHGIPEELVSDNGPQYTAEEFACFPKKIQTPTPDQ